MVNPHQIIRRVSNIVRNTAAGDLRSLKIRAENLQYHDFTTPDKFFDAHAKIILDMISCDYAKINDERTTVEFILMGLRNHPDLQHVIDVWYSDPTSTVHQIRARAAAIRTLHSQHPDRKSWQSNTTSTTQHTSHPDQISSDYNGPICNFHKFLGRRLPHAEHRCRHPDNPQGPNYRRLNFNSSTQNTNNSSLKSTKLVTHYTNTTSN